MYTTDSDRPYRLFLQTQTDRQTAGGREGGREGERTLLDMLAHKRERYREKTEDERMSEKERNKETRETEIEKIQPRNSQEQKSAGQVTNQSSLNFVFFLSFLLPCSLTNRIQDHALEEGQCALQAPDGLALQPDHSFARRL